MCVDNILDKCYNNTKVELNKTYVVLLKTIFKEGILYEKI